jgi:hypothetical protein
MRRSHAAALSCVACALAISGMFDTIRGVGLYGVCDLSCARTQCPRWNRGVCETCPLGYLPRIQSAIAQSGRPLQMSYCQAAQPGSYANATYSPDFQLCAPGSYQPYSASISCLPCLPGEIAQCDCALCAAALVRFANVAPLCWRLLPAVSG